MFAVKHAVDLVTVPIAPYRQAALLHDGFKRQPAAFGIQAVRPSESVGDARKTFSQQVLQPQPVTIALIHRHGRDLACPHPLPGNDRPITAVGGQFPRVINAGHDQQAVHPFAPQIFKRLQLFRLIPLRSIDNGLESITHSSLYKMVQKGNGSFVQVLDDDPDLLGPAFRQRHGVAVGGVVELVHDL